MHVICDQAQACYVCHPAFPEGTRGTRLALFTLSVREGTKEGVARCWRTVVTDLLFVFPLGGFEVSFSLLYGARIIVRVMEFSL